MASKEKTSEFFGQIQESRKKIRDCFKSAHEALRVREKFLLSRVDSIESEYKSKTQRMDQLVQSLQRHKSISSDSLTDNELVETYQRIHSVVDTKITELTKRTPSSIEFEWDEQFDIVFERLGSINLNGQYIISPKSTFPLHIKPVVPDYRTKQLPTAYFCNKSSNEKFPGEMNCPMCVSIHYKTGNIYIADEYNHRVQVFTSSGDYLFMFSENMNYPIGVCISESSVFVTQFYGHCISVYELEGKLIKSVGSEGSGEAEFKYPRNLDVSEKNKLVYVCENGNERVQILTEELKYRSMLGKGMLKSPHDVKVIRDRVYVLDNSNPCMFVYNSDHVLTNRLITRGEGKQTNNPFCFDIDRDYNIIMSDYWNNCVYVFNQEGEQIHMFGKKGQDIGEFIAPYGVALDNTGLIIVVCQKNSNCLQFF